jgi:3-oxoacid CoA-transferase subunit A
MLKHVLITGDMHSRIEERLQYIKDMMPEYLPEETVVIVLGDFGANYYLSKHDWKIKHHAAKFGYTIYALRGNHEQRASLVKNMEKVYDDFVHGYIYMEQEFPNIKYFADEVAEYEILGKKILCIPGAYSVDKWYRLQNNWQWFAQEQLTEEEMLYAEKTFAGKYYDFVFSHTAPLEWEPTDLFLNCIDQSTVDKTMEVWMNKFKEMINWKAWCFGHYHADRVERPYVEQFYVEVEDLTTVWSRWYNYSRGIPIEWWIPKSPNYFMDIEE